MKKAKRTKKKEELYSQKWAEAVINIMCNFANDLRRAGFRVNLVIDPQGEQA